MLGNCDRIHGRLRLGIFRRGAACCARLCLCWRNGNSESNLKLSRRSVISSSGEDLGIRARYFNLDLAKRSVAVHVRRRIAEHVLRAQFLRDHIERFFQPALVSNADHPAARFLGEGLRDSVTVSFRRPGIADENDMSHGVTALNGFDRVTLRQFAAVVLAIAEDYQSFAACFRAKLIVSGKVNGVV